MKLKTKIIGAILGLAMIFGFCTSIENNSITASASTDDVYTKVTSASSINDGDVVIFVNQDGDFACGTTQNTNNRTPVSISLTNGKYIKTSSDNVQEFTVVASSTSVQYGFHTGSGYLYSASGSSNHLKTNTTSISTKPSGTSAWTISISGGVASVMNVSNTSYYLAFNGSDYFSQYKSGQSKTTIYKKEVAKNVTDFVVLDEDANELNDGDEINIVAVNNCASTEVTCEVSYDSGNPDGNVSITCNPSYGFTSLSLDGSTYKLSFDANGDYYVSIASKIDENYCIDLIYHVEGFVIFNFAKFSGSLVEGDYIVCSGNIAMKNEINSSSRISYTSISISNNIITTDDFSIVWHISKSDSYWTLYNAVCSKYIAFTSSNGSGTLIEDITDYAKFSVTNAYDFVNVGNSGRFLRYNPNYGFASYAASTGEVLTLYKKVSTEPAINIEITSGSSKLDVNSTATLSPTKINGASGTINWSITNNNPSAGSGDVLQLSATTGDSITVTGKLDGTATVVASLEGCDSVETNFTVTKKLSGIAVTTAPTKTSYIEGESFDTTGMVITATYDDGSSETVTSYTYTPNGNLKTSDSTITISYGDKTCTQSISVAARDVLSISISKNPTKTVYHIGDTFSSSRLELTVTYNSGNPAKITSGFTTDFDNHVFTQSDLDEGELTITVTYQGKTATFNISLEAMAGVIVPGRYFILNSSGTDCMDPSYPGSNKNPIIGNPLTSKAFDFNLVDNNTYSISFISSGKADYVYWSSSTSIRFSFDFYSNRTWTISALTGDDTGLFYLQPSSESSRYMTIVTASGDWRAYADSSSNSKIMLVEEKEMFAQNFLDSFTSGCNANGGYDSAKMDWDKAKTQFNSMSDANKAAFIANSSNSELIAAAMARYNYIVGKYDSTVFEDFMNNSSSSSNNIGSTKDINSNSTAMLATLVLTTLSLTTLLYFKRKKLFSK